MPRICHSDVDMPAVYKRISPYLEQQILSASPLELIALSYRLGIEAVREAREKLAGNDALGRVRAISRAQAIIMELHRALNPDAGDGKLARDLSDFYRYAMRRLLEANQEGSDSKLEEVLNLLSTLSEGWETTVRESAPGDVRNNAPPSWATGDFAELESHCSLSF